MFIKRLRSRNKVTQPLTRAQRAHLHALLYRSTRSEGTKSTRRSLSDAQQFKVNLVDIHYHRSKSFRLDQLTGVGVAGRLDAAQRLNEMDQLNSFNKMNHLTNSNRAESDRKSNGKFNANNKVLNTKQVDGKGEIRKRTAVSRIATNKGKQDKTTNAPKSNDKYKKLESEHSSTESNLTEEIFHTQINSSDVNTKSKMAANILKRKKSLLEAQRSYNEMSESSAILHELLGIVDAESRGSNEKIVSNGNNSDLRESCTSPAKSTTSSRLKAVVENWKKDDSLQLSPIDSWSLRNENKKPSITNGSIANRLSEVSSDPDNINYISTDDSYPADRQQYFTYVPIRQRLREAWKNKERQKQLYIQTQISRKKKNHLRRNLSLERRKADFYLNHTKQYSTHGRTNIPKGNVLELRKNFTKSSHLLPHPDDLMLVSRKEGIAQQSDLSEN